MTWLVLIAIRAITVQCDPNITGRIASPVHTAKPECTLHTYGNLQVPWRALQSQPVLMEMSDVWLSASPRQEEEWEEASAGQRAQASKQAELAARDLMRLSRPGIKGAAGAANLPEGSSSGWPFLSHLSAMLLNRLQMTITNVHVCFQVCCCSKKGICWAYAVILVRRSQLYWHMLQSAAVAAVAPAVWQNSLRSIVSMLASSNHAARLPKTGTCCAGACAARHAAAQVWAPTQLPPDRESGQGEPRHNPFGPCTSCTHIANIYLPVKALGMSMYVQGQAWLCCAPGMPLTWLKRRARK